MKSVGIIFLIFLVLNVKKTIALPYSADINKS